MRDDSPTLTAVGLMADTSLNGVCASLLVTDGEGQVAPGRATTIAYTPETRAAVIRARRAAVEGRDEAQDIAEAASLVTTAHVDAVKMLLAEAVVPPTDVDVIGFHGQTILHRAPGPGWIGRTWQIGGGGILAQELGIDVVAQFRTEDMAEGGNGAPLAPPYYPALCEYGQVPEGPVAVLNLGSLANVTFVPWHRDVRDLIAFDCGPGDGLLNQWVHLSTGLDMDQGGKLAASGTVHVDVVRMMALHPFLLRKPPKSLDLYDFKLDPVGGLSVADGAATLTAFTAVAVARGVRQMPDLPRGVVAGGRGRHNPVLMAAIAKALGDIPLISAEDAGWRGDSLEAEAFAFLAVRRLRDLPTSFPGITRVPRPVRCGTIHRAPR